MAIDSVESARVHLSLAESTVFRDDRKPSKASVSIIPRAGHQLSARTVSGIQHLMSAAVPDLEMADVVVLDGHGDVVSAPVMPMTETSPPSVGQKAAVEQYYSARLRLALQRYYPDDQLSVSVLADPMPPSGTVGAEQGRDVFGAWGPGSRKFALSVSIQITAPFGPEVRDQIQRAAAQAIDLGAAPGDTIRVASGPVAQVSDPSASLRSARGPRATDAVSVARPNTATPGRIWLALIPLLVVLLIVALLLHRLGPGPRRLSTAQRRAYAARLTSLLHPEVVRANSGF